MATAVVVLGGLSLVAACGGSGSLRLTAPVPTGRAAAQCAALVTGAPPRVDGQDRRSLSPPTRFATAWGDPAIVLRCGGPPPPALRPTSRCFVIDGVGWLVTHAGQEVDPAQPVAGPLVFTTIGRTPYVAVEVPGTYQPAADAVVDLTRTVKGHTTLERPCR